ncbi:diguanylate cyclase [Vibrio sp. 10N.286.49.B3]|uniref:sensor domain-containing diguanylate cyclase n=1 Tax=Vibrio sp. 10N.286.49.B3 TaxID=1880855 RepID=UPI000C829367|nr:sensor domain-containing diguanylate cyclase [Vibrio sp. 10N.286.49.B3]PMH44897.1 diguanylate cyclase [Vibrio sp. 10N.286.49.B3]
MDKSRLEEYEAIITSLPDLVFVLTETGRYAAVFGGDYAEQYHDGSFLENFSLFDVLSKQKANWFIERIKETLAINKLQIFEYSLAAYDVDNINPSSGPTGELRFEGRVSPLNSLRYGERAVVWVARNITQRYELEQQLTYQAETDSLSNAFNRRKLFKCLDEAFYNFQRYKEDTSFLILDIDDFKQINDQFGHQVGDSVIRKITETCQLELRQTDVFGRIGGDEFGVIFKGTAEATLAFAKRLNELVQANSSGLNISISIGISPFKESDISTSQVYQRADVALYQSKKAGKNTYSAH